MRPMPHLSKTLVLVAMYSGASLNPATADDMEFPEVPIPKFLEESGVWVTDIPVILHGCDWQSYIGDHTFREKKRTEDCPSDVPLFNWYPLFCWDWVTDPFGFTLEIKSLVVTPVAGAEPGSPGSFQGLPEGACIDEAWLERELDGTIAVSTVTPVSDLLNDPQLQSAWSNAGSIETHWDFETVIAPEALIGNYFLITTVITVPEFFAAAPPCEADLQCDGAVGYADLLTLLASWGNGAADPADLDGDGTVGAADLLLLIAAWGAC